MYAHQNCCVRQSSRMLAQLYFKRANSQIMDILFRRHRHTIFQLCLSYLKNRIDAEDATMEIFESLHLYLGKYHIRHFYSWLIRFSRNHCLQRLRQQQKQRLPPPGEVCEVPVYERRSKKDRQIEQLHRAMDRLNRAQRECLFAFYFEERSYKETARHLELTPAAVKSHIQNGRRNLKILLNQMAE